MKKRTNKKLIGLLIPIVGTLLVLGNQQLNNDQASTEGSDYSITSTSQSREELVNQNEINLDYDGVNQVVTVNENTPNFSEDDLSLNENYWQTFSDLDSLNRVGVANALLQKDFMPSGERGEISSVYPSGWKQKKLSNGTWLYNRSHLIGYQLTGENANWKNLFTGTEQMNQDVMVTFENEVATYLKETGNHVRYRVTPYFKDNELVCRGVQMEAESIETKEISYNVFIYNIQDGYTINYEDGTSSAT